jgi:hypothetical protein
MTAESPYMDPDACGTSMLWLAAGFDDILRLQCHSISGLPQLRLLV